MPIYQGKSVGPSRSPFLVNVTGARRLAPGCRAAGYIFPLRGAHTTPRAGHNADRNGEREGFAPRTYPFNLQKPLSYTQPIRLNATPRRGTTHSGRAKPPTQS